MLVNLKDLLDYAEEKQVAIGAFNVPDLAFLRGVIYAAEELKVPVIIQHAEVHENFVSIEEIGPAMIAMAQNATVPVAVHLDHGTTMQECIKAIRLGFTSIMYDASLKDYDTNVRETKELVSIAHSVGVSVEAELGEMANSTIGSEAEASPEKIGEIDYFTNPYQAKDFQESTGVDCLAIAFGTVHGEYLTEPRLDFKRIKEIRKETNGLPLVMHGGSGVSDKDYRRAIASGIRKINYYTYMNLSAGHAMKEYVQSQKSDYFYDQMVQFSIDAIKNNVMHALKIFNNLN